MRRRSIHFCAGIAFALSFLAVSGCGATNSAVVELESAPSFFPADPEIIFRDLPAPEETDTGRPAATNSFVRPMRCIYDELGRVVVVFRIVAKTKAEASLTADALGSAACSRGIPVQVRVDGNVTELHGRAHVRHGSAEYLFAQVPQQRGEGEWGVDCAMLLFDETLSLSDGIAAVACTEIVNDKCDFFLNGAICEIVEAEVPVYFLATR